MGRRKKEWDAGGGGDVGPAAIAEQPADLVDIKVLDVKKMMGRPPKFESPAQLQKRIDEYFDYCDPHLEYQEIPFFASMTKMWVVDKQLVRTPQQPYTVSGLAVFLDCDRLTILRYQDLVKKKPEDLPVHLRHKEPKILLEFCNTIKRAKSKIESGVERRLLGGGHPVGAIFNLKNNFAEWKDESVVNNPEGDKLREEIDDLRQQVSGKYQKLKKKR